MILTATSSDDLYCSKLCWMSPHIDRHTCDPHVLVTNTTSTRYIVVALLKHCSLGLFLASVCYIN